ncbi:MAG: hypothetical protein VW771_00175, partial [Gammaproteobacteria bacterium]
MLLLMAGGAQVGGFPRPLPPPAHSQSGPCGTSLQITVRSENELMECVHPTQIPTVTGRIKPKTSRPVIAALHLLTVLFMTAFTGASR